MNRLIKGARYDPEKTRLHRRSLDEDATRNVDLMYENSGECFRNADPNGSQSYLLSREMLEHKSHLVRSVVRAQGAKQEGYRRSSYQATTVEELVRRNDARLARLRKLIEEGFD